jgi:uncharacterized protein (TIGR00730 family)
MKVCVFAASSHKLDPVYFEAARQLGTVFVEQNIEVNYGGGAVGLMGCLADTMLQGGGKITGIIPGFMIEAEWSHPEVNEMLIVADMHERKKLLIEGVDAVVALPGGCGTLEELMEVITLKQLGKFLKPIILLNVNHFYDGLLVLLDKMIEQHFMRPEHRAIWQVVEQASDVPKAIAHAPKWDASVIKIAAV